MSFRLTLVASASLVVLGLMAPAAAWADNNPIPGYYIGAGVGLSQLTDQEIDISGTKNESSYDSGMLYSGSFGYAWGNGLRTEAELSYRNGEIDSITGTGAGPQRSGDFSALTPMFNLLWDLHYFSDVLTPYVGAGVGFAHVTADDVRTVAGRRIDGSEGTFAYQGIIGAAYHLDRNWAMTADYRYQQGLDSTISTNAAGIGAKAEYGSHNFLLGVRYTFAEADAPPPSLPPAPAPIAQAAPAPAPVAEMPPAMPQAYMVFFDFDRASLTPEAERILATAANDFRNGRNVRLHVSGHADRSGKEGYNMRLSQRRANAVRDTLARLGVPDSIVVTRAAGERENLVPTADGVREAQNRRAEIYFGDVPPSGFRQ